MSEQAGRYQRSFSGLLGAMVVLVVLVVLVVGFRTLTQGDVERSVRPVEFASAAEFAGEQAAFRVLSPQSLPDGWVATSVRFRDSEDRRGQSWHLGMLTDEEQYVGLEQADRSTGFMVEEHVDAEAVPGDPVVVDGEEWLSFTDPGGDRALVRRSGGATTLVVGPVTTEVLTTLLDRLDSA